MPAPNFFGGGLASVKVDDVGGDFLTPDFSATQFSKEGQQYPAPADLVDTLSDEQEIITGEEVPFLIRCTSVTEAEADALRTANQAGTYKDVQFVSKSGPVTLVAKNVLLKAQYRPFAEGNKLGVLELSGKATAFGTSRAYTLTTS
jgi:hypothetical protein